MIIPPDRLASNDRDRSVPRCGASGESDRHDHAAREPNRDRPSLHFGVIRICRIGLIAKKMNPWMRVAALFFDTVSDMDVRIGTVKLV